MCGRFSAVNETWGKDEEQQQFTNWRRRSSPQEVQGITIRYISKFILPNQKYQQQEEEVEERNKKERKHSFVVRCLPDDSDSIIEASICPLRHLPHRAATITSP